MILPKEDVAIFKQQFRHLFAVSGWFNTLSNAEYSKDGSMNGFMHLGAPKRCSPLEHGNKQSELAWWLGAYARLTSELVSQVVELFVEWHAEYTCSRATWNEAAWWAHQKSKSQLVTTPKVVEPHPEQVPTLLKRVMDKSLQHDDAINDMAVLLYNDEDDIEFLTW